MTINNQKYLGRFGRFDVIGVVVDLRVEFWVEAQEVYVKPILKADLDLK